MVALSEIQSLANRIAKEYRPERIILFGSHAIDAADADSDVDLLIVMPDDGDCVGKAAEIRGKVLVDFPLDVIVRSPQDLEWRLNQRDWFLLEIVKTGKVLHEATHG